MRSALAVRRWGLPAAVLVVLACGDMRQDELDCELAVAHLQGCCPSLSASHIDCTFVQGSGCGSPTIDPFFTIAQSECIRDQSCSTLVSDHVCDDVNALVATPPLDGGQTWSSTQVCP